MMKHMPPPFPQALYGKIIQTKSQVRDANFIWDSGKLNQDQIFLMDLVFLKASPYLFVLFVTCFNFDFNALILISML